MVVANPQKLLGRNKKIQSEVDGQQQQLTAAPINIAVSQNILKSLAKITQLISQQNSQIVEIIKEVKQSKSTDVKPQQQLIASPADTKSLGDISRSLTSIIQLLSQQNTQTTRDGNETRKGQEQSRRKGIELGLENSFATVKNVAQSVVAPVKSILDQIIQFFVTIFLGRALILLLEWFSDEKNKSKIKSIIRFLSDFWPSLVAGYILFGTGFGRIVRKISGIAIGAVARLVVISARLIKAIATGKGLKGAAQAFSGGGKLGGLKGGLLKLALGTAATVGGGMLLNKAVNSGGEGEAPQLNVPEVPDVPALGAYTGGLVNIKNLFSGSTSGLTSKFNVPEVPDVPTLGAYTGGLINSPTFLFGSGGLADIMQNFGFVSGPKGIDKVPAMLTDGEFVMSRGAVQKFGVRNLEEMNAAGGGTNKPKIIQKRIHAYGGGFIGDEELHRQAANYNRGANLKEIPFDPKNQEHKNAYEKFKKRVVDKGLYKPSIEMDGPNIKNNANVKTNVNVNYNSPSSKSSMVRSPGAGLSTNVKPINKNMNVPGGKGIGKGSLGSGIGGAIAVTLVEMFAPQIQEAVGNVYNKMGIGMGNLSDKQLKTQIEDELKNQKLNSSGPGGALMGDHLNSSSNERMQLLQKELGKRNLSQGDAIKGGFGLKDQSFKDAPKTQIMTDDKGKPFIGHKSMKNGKLHYSRGSQPGTGTSNPLEAFGRFINPGAYKDNDAKLAMQNQRVAATNSLESLQARGASADTQSGMLKQIGANSNQTQNDLSYRQKQATITKTKPKTKSITPTPKPTPTYIPAGGGMGGRRGSGANPSTSKPSVPSFNTSSGSNRRNANIYGIK